MRARAIALLCLGGGVLLSCSKDRGENENGVSANVTIVVPTHHGDTWTALEPILKDAGFTFTVKNWHGYIARNLDDPDLRSWELYPSVPLEFVATHKNGTKLDVKLVPGAGRTWVEETGDTTVSITEDMEPAEAADVAEWLDNRQWPKLLQRLKAKSEKR